MTKPGELCGIVADMWESFTEVAWKDEKKLYAKVMKELAAEIQTALDSDIEFFEKVSVVRYALRLMTEETDYTLSSGGFKRGVGNV